MSYNLILANAAPQTVSIGPGAPQTASVAAPQTVITVEAGQAAAPAQEMPSVPWYANPMFMILIMLALLMFFTFRSNKKQRQKREQMLDSIVKGSRVMLNTGIYGTITEVREKTYLIEIADKVMVEVIKGGVSEVRASSELEATPGKK